MAVVVAVVAILKPIGGCCGSGGSRMNRRGYGAERDVSEDQQSTCSNSGSSSGGGGGMLLVVALVVEDELLRVIT